MQLGPIQSVAPAERASLDIDVTQIRRNTHYYISNTAQQEAETFPTVQNVLINHIVSHPQTYLFNQYGFSPGKETSVRECYGDQHTF